MYRNLICLLALAGSLGAAPVTVNNFSFEDFNPLDLNCAGTNCAFNLQPIPGWTTTADAGSFRPGNPSNTDYFDFIPDGAIVAYSNGSPISQVVGTVAADTTYKLLVDVGNRKEQNAAGSVALVVDGIFYNASPVAIAEGGWSTFSVDYTSSPGDVGSPLQIVLAASGFQGNFDNVRLSRTESPIDNTPVPEPAGLGAAGLALLVAARRYWRS
jgi:hypothetical protein